MQDDDAAARLRAEIRERRKAAGLSQRVLADRIGYGRDYVSKLEAGGRLPSAPLTAALDEALGAGGVLVELRARAWHQRQADRLGIPEPQPQEDRTDRRQFVGGLAAAALVAADVSRRIAGAGPDELTLDELEAELDQIATSYSTVSHEDVAPRIISTWRQVEAALAGRTSLSVRGRLTLLAGQATYYAGRVGFNMGDEPSARRFAVLAEQYAADVGDPALVGSVAGLRSSIAYYAGRYRTAAELAAAGRRHCHPFNRSRLAAYEARAQAAAGNSDAARAALVAMVDDLWGGASMPGGSPFGEATSDMFAGVVRERLGDHLGSEPYARVAVERLGRSGASYEDLGHALLTLSASLAFRSSPRVDEATDAAGRALQALTDRPTRTVLDAAGRLWGQMNAAYPATTAVRVLGEQMTIARASLPAGTSS